MGKSIPHIFPFHNKAVKYYERRDVNESTNSGRSKQAAQHSHPGPDMSGFGKHLFFSKEVMYTFY